MPSRAVRVLAVMTAALLASCGASSKAAQPELATTLPIRDTSTSSIGTASTSPILPASTEELAEFAEIVVGTVNEMQKQWDGRVAETDRLLGGFDSAERLNDAEDYYAEAEHFAAIAAIMLAASVDLPDSAPEGSDLLERYVAFRGAHSDLVGAFSQASEDLAANTPAYSADHDIYTADIRDPLDGAIERYIAACFELQSTLVESYDGLLLCGPQPPAIGPHGFMLFTGEDAKMRRPGHYENSDFFRTITFESDGNWICNNECSHGHEEFGNALELKFTEVAGAWLIIVNGGDKTAADHVKSFEDDPEISITEPVPFAPSSDVPEWEGITFTIEPSQNAGYNFRCGASSNPCAVTDLGKNISEWTVSYSQTIWVLTRPNGLTIVASAHFSPGYIPPEIDRETLLESARPLVASLGFPD